MMEARLNCHERARMSAAASTGSIESIPDVFMGRGGRQQRLSRSDSSGGSTEGFCNLPLQSLSFYQQRELTETSTTVCLGSNFDKAMARGSIFRPALCSRRRTGCQTPGGRGDV